MARNKNQQRKEKARIYASALSDLTTRDVDVEIELPGDDSPIIIIPMRTLSYGEWQRFEHEIPAPIPPTMGGLSGITVNDKDPDYLKAREARNTRIMYLRILAALKLPVDGNTDDEKIEALKRMDTIIINGLINALWQAHMTGEARVMARAESFHPAGHRGTPSLPVAGLEVVGVDGATGVGAD